ncbi:MAG: hypothetical protein IJ054_00620 [Lachnospiraceae bacterium]|nr:hypothetical protein [Lachnospiraceae bacterium]MBQ9232872.1 hypothetical protein [Lachnospiraceae bacterium]
MPGNKRSILNIKNTVVIFLAAVFFVVSFIPYDVDASGNISISSMDDFYVMLSNQIYDHEVDASYDVPDYELVKSIMDISMEDYQFHYDENNPLISGCYLSHYIEYLNIYYSHEKLRILIKFKYSKSEMESHFSMMQELADELKSDTDYETVQNVHDYLIKNFEYDKKTIFVNHTDIDGFKDKQMVCSGYSLAAYNLLNQAGIPTRVITGYGGDGRPDETNHMWNMVCLDGKWYNMDITWDDTNGKMPTYNYFLKNDKDFPMHLRRGKYDNDYFKYSLSETSYKLPMRLKFGNFKFYIIVVAVVLIAMSLFAKVINKRRNKRLQALIASDNSKLQNSFGLNSWDDFDENQSSQALDDDEIPRL